MSASRIPIPSPHHGRITHNTSHTTHPPADVNCDEAEEMDDEKPHTTDVHKHTYPLTPTVITHMHTNTSNHIVRTSLLDHEHNTHIEPTRLAHPIDATSLAHTVEYIPPLVLHITQHWMHTKPQLCMPCERCPGVCWQGHVQAHTCTRSAQRFANGHTVAFVTTPTISHGHKMPHKSRTQLAHGHKVMYKARMVTTSAHRCSGVLRETYRTNVGALIQPMCGFNRWGYVGHTGPPIERYRPNG